MKEGWNYKKFEDALEKVKYTRKLQTNEFLPKGSIPIISQEEDYISGYWDKNEDAFRVDNPVVIFGDHSRVVKYVDFDFVLGADGVKILKPKDFLKAKFLYHYLKWYNIPSMGYSRHYKFLKEITLPIPSLYEQEQIIKELDLLSGIIEKEKAQLDELDKLAQSIFYDMFGDPVTNEKGWDLKRLVDVSSEKLSYGSGASAVPYDGNIRYIRITDIKDNGELNNELVSPNVYDEKYLLKDGDILFARSGATVGKTYCHKETNGKCIYAGYLIRLIPNRDIVLSSYVFGYTKTEYYQNFVRLAQNAVAQPNINAKQYGELAICIPPLSLQQEFADKISDIEAMKAKVRQSLKEAEQLFNSRMEYYFN